NPGNDTITFANNVNGTITLTTGEIAISEAVTITGPGTGVLTISGNNASRIFNTSSAPTNAAMFFSGLTFTAARGASFGGAIFGGDEQLTLLNCVFSGNSTAQDGGGAIAL